MNRNKWFKGLVVLTVIVAIAGVARWMLETQFRLRMLESQVETLQKAVIRAGKGKPPDPSVCAELARRVDAEYAKGSELAAAIEKTAREYGCWVAERK